MGYFDPGVLNDPEATLDDYAAIAADAVQKLAPVPTPVPADYPGRAARAERLILNWLQSTSGGLLTSGGASGLSAGFAGMPEVKAIVASSMGSYSKVGRVVIRSAYRG